MTTWLLRLFGKHVAHNTVAPHTTNGGLLDVRFGLALLRDRRVPAASKLMALLAGAILTALAVEFELPVEGLIALLLPVFGILADFAVSGLEAVAGPILLAALILPHVAPPAIVNRIREEHNPFPARAQA